MTDLDPSHHIFRHIGGARIHDDFIEPAAFRRKKKQDGQIEEGLSVNWVEYFEKHTPQEAIPLLRDTFLRKGRTVGPTSKFALLNVGEAKTAALKYATVAIGLDEQLDDPSHSLVKGYDEALNDQGYTTAGIDQYGGKQPDADAPSQPHFAPIAIAKLFRSVGVHSALVIFRHPGRTSFQKVFHPRNLDKLQMRPRSIKV